MKLNGLDLNKLHTFIAVVDHRGYKAASEHLGLSRSAISQSITALEAQLKKPLFHRRGVKLLPTSEALDLYREGKLAVASLESAVDRFQNRAPHGSGLLRVGAYEEFARRKLLPVVQKFLDDQPRRQIQFQFDSPSRLEALLEADRIDLAISIYPHRLKGIESRKLYEEELCLIARKDLAPASATLLEIARLPLVEYYPSHMLFKRWWAVHSRKPPPQLSIRAYAATADMVLEMVLRGIGAAVVPKYLVQGHGKELRVLNPTGRVLIDHLWLHQKRACAKTPVEEAFLRELARILPY